MRMTLMTGLVAVFLCAAPLLAGAQSSPAVAKMAVGEVLDVDEDEFTITVDAGVFHIPRDLEEVFEEVEIGDGVDIVYTGEREVTDLRIHEPS